MNEIRAEMMLLHFLLSFPKHSLVLKPLVKYKKGAADDVKSLLLLHSISTLKHHHQNTQELCRK